MKEEFTDLSWLALNHDARMYTYWKCMDKAGIDQAKAEEFLFVIWEICASTKALNFLRRQRAEELVKVNEREVLQRHNSNYELRQETILAGGKMFSMPAEPDELVMAATASRKRNDALDCGRYLALEAKDRFGSQLYEAIAVAVTVALGLDEKSQLSAERLRQSFYDLHKTQSHSP